MKRKLFFLLLIVLITLNNKLVGQTQFSIGLLAGWDNGLSENVNFNLHTSESLFYSLSFKNSSYEIKKQIDDYTYKIPYSLLSSDIMINFSFAKNPKSSFNFGLGIGGSVAIEKLNKGNKELETGAELQYTGGLIYGGSGKLFFIYNLSEKLDLVLENKIQYYLNSQVGQINNFTGLGIRFYLN